MIPVKLSILFAIIGFLAWLNINKIDGHDTFINLKQDCISSNKTTCIVGSKSLYEEGVFIGNEDIVISHKCPNTTFKFRPSNLDSLKSKNINNGRHSCYHENCDINPAIQDSKEFLLFADRCRTHALNQMTPEFRSELIFVERAIKLMVLSWVLSLFFLFVICTAH
jgi:hypothetical protein